MMPGTAVKHDRLVKLARARFNGWEPVVSGPDDAYRTYAVQEHYYRTFPPGMAAWPGTSSHGGSYEGEECGAVDYGNWGQVGKQPWYQLLRDAGFEPGFFDGQYGRPVEPWHAIDRTPWHVPAAPKPRPPIDIEDEDTMTRTFIQESRQGSKYELLRDGTKRLIPTPEWNAIRSLEAEAKTRGQEFQVVVATVTAADLKKIPTYK
ncbi:hypothetical protein [Microbacterium sp. YY-01]|uniref:hypothetical protein n=1 Tax=Microbacterium sp. YY-01 TaxID=3421634 RepID=UPI003D17198D